MPGSIFDLLNQRIEKAQTRSLDALSDNERRIVEELLNSENQESSLEALRSRLDGLGGVWEDLARLVSQGWLIPSERAGGIIYRLKLSQIEHESTQNIWESLRERLASRR